MSASLPLAGLLYNFRHENERFHQLCTIVMKESLQKFLAELSPDDLLYDPTTQITLLHMAAATGNLETLQYLLDQGQVIDFGDMQGNTPLHFAALSGYDEGIRFLLEHGADKSVENNWEQAPWQVASTGELMILLLTEAAISDYSPIPKVSLREAVEHKDIPTVKRLLTIGVHPNLLNEGNYQVEFRLPLHMAIDTKNVDLVRLLLEYDADPIAPGLSIHVPLEQAIKQNNLEIVRLLLAYEANPNHYMGSTLSLLHQVTQNNQLEIMELLLTYGADPDVQVKGHYFYHPPLREAQSVEAIRLLIKYGAKTDPALMGKFSFFIWPMDRGQTDVVREFIRIGVPVDSAELWNTAIKSNHRHQQMVPLCKLLLEAGLDVNLPIDYYGFPIFRAIRYRSSELVELFLDYGANLQALDPNGYTPYEVAMSIVEPKIAKSIAVYLQKSELPVPQIQQTPSLERVEAALTLDHSDLIQASLYSSDGSPKHYKLFKKLMEMLHYSPNALPLQIDIDDEGEEENEHWDENYIPKAPLSNYKIAFHPDDPRCFILIVSWYDEYAFSFVYHIHVRCEAKYEQAINQLFADWSPEFDEEELDEEFLQFIKHYKHGHYHYDWKQAQPTKMQIEIQEEAHTHYLEAVKHLHNI
jgi:ankyrin repeat protein